MNAISRKARGKKLRITIEGQLAEVLKRIHTRKRHDKVTRTALVINEAGQRMGSDAQRSRFDTARKIAGVDYASFQFRDLRAKAGTDKTETTGDIRAAQRCAKYG